PVKNFKKLLRMVLTVWVWGPRYRFTNDGGDAAGDGETRSTDLGDWVDVSGFEVGLRWTKS
ncbi:hypothetical protein DRY68_24460, partial [Salmonella enterica subsp. enterica serovar Braenderup]|nr:hypothetical protein [Salmonella enterica subsp. enterica serovar Braenderup]